MFFEIVTEVETANGVAIAVIGSIITGGEGSIGNEMMPAYDPQGYSLTGQRQIYSAPAAITQYEQRFPADATDISVRIGADVMANFAWVVVLPGIGGVHKANGNEGTYIENFNPTAHHLLGAVDQTVAGVTPSSKNAVPTINSDMNWAAYLPGAQYHAIGQTWQYALGNNVISDFNPWTTFLQHECLNLHGTFEYPVIPRTVAEWEEWIQDCKKPQYFFIPVALGYMYSFSRALPNGRLNGSPLTIKRTQPKPMKDLIVVDSAETGWVAADSSHSVPYVSISVIGASVSPEEQRAYKRGPDGGPPRSQIVFMRKSVTRSMTFTAQRGYVSVPTQEVLMGGLVMFTVAHGKAADRGLGMGETGAGGQPMIQAARQSAAGSKAIWELGNAALIKGEFARFRGFKPNRFSGIAGWTFTPEVELYLEQNALVGGSINFSMFQNYMTEVHVNAAFHGESMRMNYICDFMGADVWTPRSYQIGSLS